LAFVLSGVASIAFQGASKPRKGASKSGVQNDSRGSKHETTKADGTITIVLAFVACVLVAVVAFA